jgi:hypothetical protein
LNFFGDRVPTCHAIIGLFGSKVNDIAITVTEETPLDRVTAFVLEFIGDRIEIESSRAIGVALFMSQGIVSDVGICRETRVNVSVPKFYGVGIFDLNVIGNQVLQIALDYFVKFFASAHDALNLEISFRL